MKDRKRKSGAGFAALLLSALLAVAAGPALAGSMPLQWDPVADTDLAGYRVYYGTTPGSYSSNVDVGNVTSYTLTGLTDCTRYYIAVKAYDINGNLSTGYSNELSGLPTPVVSTASPSSGEQGQSLTVAVTGSNFDTGAVVQFADPKITVSSTSYISCSEVRASISIASDAAIGGNNVDVMNPDRSYGRKASGFQVTAVTVPSVTGSNPAAGATNVGVTVKPTVTFSERMDPATITTATVRLLKTDGTAVAQAAGSPVLDAAGTTATITPAANLAYSTTYKIQVVGGASGVKDSLGTAMASTWDQNPGFTTAQAPDTTPPNVSSASPADGAIGVNAAVKPTVLFSERMDPATITSSTVRLLKPDGTAVAQAAGSPALDAAGTTATITPAAALSENTWYKIQVVGGASGVKDQAGNAMSSTWTQSQGFQTAGVPPANVVNLRRVDRKP